MKLSSFINGAVIASALASVPAGAITVPPEVKSAVAFIYARDAKGALVANGTGFFIGVPSILNPSINFVYLVTAKHVLRPSESSPDFFPEVQLRVNRKTGDARPETFPLRLSGPQKNVFVHDDPTVDLAVIPLAPSDEYDYEILGDGLLTTQKDFVDLQIHEGSEVFFTGLFTPHPGATRNLPIVRFGRVAMISNEKVDWNGEKTDLYLIESASYGGNSGSPVFFYLGADRTPGMFIMGPPVLKLAGVMRGTHLERRPITIQTAATAVSQSSMGIALVTPAYKLREILFGNALAGQRATAPVAAPKKAAP